MESVVIVLKALILPPGLNVLLALVAMVIWGGFRRTARTLLIVSVASLYLFATPAVSRLLAGTLEQHPAVAPETELGDFWQAIVVLSGGRKAVAPEYGSEVPNSHSLERARFAARLAKRTGLPLLVAGGGKEHGEHKSEAQIVSDTLKEDFGYTPRWLESESRNTAENAVYARAILEREKIDKVVLVTHAMHMRRAEWAFRKQGFAVKPAPTAFASVAGQRPAWEEWLPNTSALGVTYYALHEHLGYVWYLLRY